MKLNKSKIGAYLAEFIGTFLLIVLILLSFTFIRGLEAFTIGAAWAILIYAFGRFSKAHFNPVITLASLINKRIGIIDSIAYWVAQFVATLAAYPVVVWLRNSFINYQIQQNGGSAYEGLREQIENQLNIVNTFPQGFATLAFVLEALFTLVLVLVILSATEKDENRNRTALYVGATVFVITALASGTTVASFNPFRSLVVALFKGGDAIKNVWVFILAPLVGSLVGALTYLLMNWLATSKKETKKVVVKQTVSSSKKKKAKK